MKKLLSYVMASLAVVASGPVGAADNIPPGRIYAAVTEEDLAALVRIEGHTVDEMHPMESPSVRGKTADGLLFLLIGTACDIGDVKGCQGIMMQVRYDSDDAVTVDKINEANLNEAAVGTWWDKEGKTVGFTRYVVLDEGVTHMNIRRNLRVLFDIEPRASGIVWPE